VRFRWIDFAKEAVKAFNDSGYLVLIVTNQSGVARSIIPRTISAVHRHSPQSGPRRARVSTISATALPPRGYRPRILQGQRLAQAGAGDDLDLLEHWPVGRKPAF